MIDYNYADDMIVATHRDLLITDGEVTISGTNYTVSNDTVTITNELLEQESFELQQSLCSANQLTFGLCESSSVSFTIHDNIPTLKGKTIKVYLIPDSDASKMLQIGVFKVEEDELSADRTKRQITAYDALYEMLNADVAGWYNDLLPNANSSVTLAEMRFAFTASFGVSQETISLPNDNMIIRRTIAPETLSGADVIRAICELEGCFGQISNEGKFRYVVLTPGLDDGLFPSDTLYPADDLYPQDVNHDVDVIPRAGYLDVQFEDYNVESITGLTIRTDDSDVGVTVGTTENLYIITANPLVYGKSGTELTTIATNAFGNMENRYYKPCTLEAIGNPLHEVGDGIRIRTTYRGIVTYILERKLVGIQALRDTYTANGDEKHSEQLNNIGTQYKQLASKTLSIKADVDGIAVDLSDLDSRESSHYSQTSSQISLKVSKSNIVSDLNDEMSGITIESDAIKVSSTGTFTVDSTNFKLNSSGVATLKGASITDGTISISKAYASGYQEINISQGALIASNTYQGATAELHGESLYFQDSSRTTYVGLNGLSTDGFISGGTLTIDGDGGVGGDFGVGGSLVMGTHTLSFKTVVDTNGNTVHVLGY